MCRENHTETAKRFWRNQAAYPHWDDTKIRRYYDVQFIVPRLGAAETYCDAGCGDGGTALAIREVSNIKHFYLYDQSTAFISGIKRLWGDSPVQLTAEVRELPAPLPKSDVVALFGVLPFLFDDEQLASWLGSIPSDRLLIRTPCTMLAEDELIDTHSEALGAQYAALYRTLPNTLAILGTHFTAEEVMRIWPDEIESKFGTKQFVFSCRRR
jgi:hypothetical protein